MTEVEITGELHVEGYTPDGALKQCMLSVTTSWYGRIWGIAQTERAVFESAQKQLARMARNKGEDNGCKLITKGDCKTEKKWCDNEKCPWGNPSEYPHGHIIFTQEYDSLDERSAPLLGGAR